MGKRGQLLKILKEKQFRIEVKIFEEDEVLDEEITKHSVVLRYKKRMKKLEKRLQEIKELIRWAEQVLPKAEKSRRNK